MSTGPRGTPGDPLLEHLKTRHFTRVPRRTVFTALSCLCSAAGGVILAASTSMPWRQIGGVLAPAAIREGVVLGGFAAICLAWGVAIVLLSLLSLLRRRNGRLRFHHWTALFVSPLVAGLLLSQRIRLDHDLEVVRESYPDLPGPTGLTAGMTIAFVGLGLTVAGPLLSLRQWRRSRL